MVLNPGRAPANRLVFEHQAAVVCLHPAEGGEVIFTRPCVLHQRYSTQTTRNQHGEDDYTVTMALRHGCQGLRYVGHLAEPLDDGRWMFVEPELPSHGFPAVHVRTAAAVREYSSTDVVPANARAHGGMLFGEATGRLQPFARLLTVMEAMRDCANQ